MSTVKLGKMIDCDLDEKEEKQKKKKPSKEEVKAEVEAEEEEREPSDEVMSPVLTKPNTHIISPDHSHTMTRLIITHFRVKRLKNPFHLNLNRK